MMLSFSHLNDNSATGRFTTAALDGKLQR